MSEEKLIKECPVCHSRNIMQDFGKQPFTMHTVIGSKLHTWRNGSHCDDCGTKFKFNHVTEDEFRDPERKAKAEKEAEMFGRLPALPKEVTQLTDNNLKL